MSSNLQIPKQCVFCQEFFTAKKTTTQCCSKQCSNALYKQRRRNQRINDIKSLHLIKPYVHTSSILIEKEVMSVRDVSKLLGISRCTVYRYLKEGILKRTQIWGKSFILRNELMKLLGNEQIIKSTHENKEITNFYTIEDICNKFNYQRSWVFKITKQKRVPKLLHRGKNYYSKEHIDRIFSKKQPDPTIVNWSTVEELQERFGMSKAAIYSFAYSNVIPRKKSGRIILYSKLHFEIAKRIVSPEQLYYTTEEAMSKFGVTRDSLYGILKNHKVTKVKCGRYIKISKVELDNILNLKITI